MALPGFVMRFAAYLAVACVAGMSSEAAPPPADFRQQMVDAAGACTAAYSKLASGRDSSRSDDEEMRDAARGQARLARELLKEWSDLDDDEVEEALRDVSLEIETQDFDDDQLLDFTIYCDDQLADLVETADSRGYTP